MATIQDYLDLIKNAIYGKDVRQAIHDGIQQCYYDGKAGSTDLESRQRLDVIEPKVTSAENDIALLDARIDQIVSPTGDAPSAAEVSDARISVDGVTYSLAGDAIRDQVLDLKKSLSPILSEDINLLDLSTRKPNTYINNTNGAEVSYSGWDASDYIPVKPSTSYKVLAISNGSYAEVTGQNLYWAVYKSDKTYLRGGVGVGIYTDPSGAYLRVSCPKAFFNNKIMVVTDEDASDITSASDYVPHLTTGGFSQGVNKLVEFSNSYVIYNSDDVEFDTGFVKYWNGEVETSGMSCTDYLDISDYQGMLLIVKAKKPVGNRSGLAFYDADKNFLQGVDYDDAGNTSEVIAHDIRVQVPKNAVYLRASTVDVETVKDDFAVLLDVKHMLDNIYQYEPLLASDDIHWVDFDPLGLKISLSDGWKANAEQAYENAQNYLKATNAYDFASLFIETDSHGRGTLPFNWMQKYDDSVRCVHLGDMVTDNYNSKELEYYYNNTKECKSLISLVGNHEVNKSSSSEQGNQYDLIRWLNSTDRRLADPVGCFSVIDYDQRIKYICLNPYKIITGGSECAITSEQMTWLINELNNSEFDIIMLSHNPINDNDLEDREGNSGSSWIGGPYATGYNVINRLLKAFKNRTSGRIETTEYGNIDYDFTSITVDLICAIAGHTHHELFKTDTYVTYVANWYGNTHSCVFFVADRTNKKIAFFQFDNSTVYETLEFDY